MLNVIADAQMTDLLNWLNQDILEKRFYLETREINGEETFRKSLEYRKYP
jgi:hypothetical protein